MFPPYSTTRLNAWGSRESSYKNLVAIDSFGAVLGVNSVKYMSVSKALSILRTIFRNGT